MSGSNLAKPPADVEDPVNEPCYTAVGCRGFDAATGGPTSTPIHGVCCVKIGTCDGMTVSSSSNYYEGGCRPFFGGGIVQTKQMTGNYVKSAWNQRANTSTSANYPTSDHGCYKQGECVLPYIELVTRGSYSMGMTANDGRSPDLGGKSIVAQPSAATMDRLLANAAERVLPRRLP